MIIEIIERKQEYGLAPEREYDISFSFVNKTEISLRLREREMLFLKTLIDDAIKKEKVK